MFYLRYLKFDATPKPKAEFFCFDSAFYTTITENRKNYHSNDPSPTGGVNIFEKDFIVVPLFAK
jgi:Ulp1 family protease